ncbi:hypothetical protein KL86SPO_50781 [uncultured Sporomusa sp.]|uniref:Uncharacterized protein n=1 Tax=uncultured Sporomusa sp. TaxID=307249 RepID=A0A212M039_9FIRM|nr:hypothetical protein KL86SPO_50781 [uncultured Sporomusa sp.]
MLHPPLFPRYVLSVSVLGFNCSQQACLHKTDKFFYTGLPLVIIIVLPSPFNFLHLSVKM